MFKYSFIAVIVSTVLLSACADSHQKSAEKPTSEIANIATSAPAR